MEPPPDTPAIAEVALAAALNGEQPVLLASTERVNPIIAALVLRRAGVKLEQVFQRSLTNEQFAALADALRAVKNVAKGDFYRNQL